MTADASKLVLDMDKIKILASLLKILVKTNKFSDAQKWTRNKYLYNLFVYHMRKYKI